MRNLGKGMIIILLILYVVSPVDLCPGPIDDTIMILLGLAANKRIAMGEEEG